MAIKTKLMESEIQELALIYAREKLSWCLDHGVFHEQGLKSLEIVELEFLFETYKSAWTEISNLNSQEMS